MRITKLRLYIAGLVAIVMGIPMTSKVLAGTGDVIVDAIDLGISIADSAGNS